MLVAEGNNSNLSKQSLCFETLTPAADRNSELSFSWCPRVGGFLKTCVLLASPFYFCSSQVHGRQKSNSPFLSRTDLMSAAESGTLQLKHAFFFLKQIFFRAVLASQQGAEYSCAHWPRSCSSPVTNSSRRYKCCVDEPAPTRCCPHSP